jgi:hypothetical protein
MVYRYRCSRERCRARISLPRLLEAYIRKPKCRVCGGRLTLDRCRQTKKDTVFNSCWCDATHYPHRVGSLKGCKKIKKMKFKRGTFNGRR